MAALQIYCVKCRTKRDVEKYEETTLKSGRPAVKAVCPVCGTTLYRIGKVKKD